jgi:hypothetical protein
MIAKISDGFSKKSAYILGKSMQILKDLESQGSLLNKILGKPLDFIIIKII